MPGKSDEAIRARAYEIWLAEGRPHGHDYDHWLRAANEIEAASAKPARKPRATVAGTTEAKAATAKPAKTKAPTAKISAVKPAATKAKAPLENGAAASPAVAVEPVVPEPSPATDKAPAAAAKPRATRVAKPKTAV